MLRVPGSNTGSRRVACFLIGFAAMLTVHNAQKSDRRHSRLIFWSVRFAGSRVPFDVSPAGLRPIVSVLLPDFTDPIH